MSDKNWNRGLIVYAIFAVITFGHAFQNNKIVGPQRNDWDTDQRRAEYAVASGLMCAMAWPLYWSAQAARLVEAGKQP